LSSPEEAEYFLLEGIPLILQCGEGHIDMIVHGNVCRVEEKHSVQEVSGWGGSEYSSFEGLRVNLPHSLRHCVLYVFA
jgi:hypothetical protein